MLVGWLLDPPFFRPFLKWGYETRQPFHINRLYSRFFFGLAAQSRDKKSERIRSQNPCAQAPSSARWNLVRHRSNACRRKSVAFFARGHLILFLFSIPDDFSAASLSILRGGRPLHVIDHHPCIGCFLRRKFQTNRALPRENRFVERSTATRDESTATGTGLSPSRTGGFSTGRPPITFDSSPPTPTVKSTRRSNPVRSTTGLLQISS